MQCIILAGGRGTRMRPLTDTIPKSLIPVNERPFLFIQLEHLFRCGVDKVLFSLGYKGEAIVKAVKEHAIKNCHFDFVFDGDEPLGTAGAIRRALDESLLDERFLVLYGDSFLPVDFGLVWRHFNEGNLAALMTVFRNNGQWDKSNVLFRNGKVLYDKQHTLPEMAHIDYGLSCLSRDIISEQVPSGKIMGLDEVFNKLSTEGRLGGFEVTQRFYEIGSPRGLKDLEQFLLRGAN
jgi:NDP-sugar pyrophosphorylase family protein